MRRMYLDRDGQVRTVSDTPPGPAVAAKPTTTVNASPALLLWPSHARQR
jgi:hypothetical protein